MDGCFISTIFTLNFQYNYRIVAVSTCTSLFTSSKTVFFINVSTKFIEPITLHLFQLIFIVCVCNVCIGIKQIYMVRTQEEYEHVIHSAACNVYTVIHQVYTATTGVLHCAHSCSTHDIHMCITLFYTVHTEGCILFQYT